MSDKNNTVAEILSFAVGMRDSYRALIPQAGIGDKVGEIRDMVIPADDPVRQIPLRIYFPLQDKSQVGLPVLLYLHGGGFVSGDLDTHDVLLRSISNRAECIVVSVDYRLAPENPFPAGLEDAYTALCWLTNNAESINADKTRIVVGGDSAGGNLAVALAILARDRHMSILRGQWLMYATLSNKMDTASWAALGDNYFPTRVVNQQVISAYVPEGHTPYDPLIAPLWANLNDLPPTLIQVGGLDPLCDENKLFAEKLETNGNHVQFFFYPDLQHGFLQFYKDSQNFAGAEFAFEQGIKWLRELFFAHL